MYIKTNVGQAVLVRSGQVVTTLGGGSGGGGGVRRCKEDEQLLAAILGRDNRGYIVDTRTHHMTATAKVHVMIKGFIVDTHAHKMIATGLQPR